MRLTKNIFNDMAVWMIGFGIIVGCIFPFFVLLFGIESSIAFSSMFVFSCILAGSFVGAVNILISRLVLSERFKIMTLKMNKVEKNLLEIASGDSHEQCSIEECRIPVDSDDVIGDSVIAYNNLVKTLALTMKNEMLISLLDLESLGKRALPLLMQATGSQGGALLIEREGDLQLQESQGIKVPETLIRNDAVLSVARNRERAVITLPDNIVLDGILAEFYPRQIILEPLMYNESLQGIVLMATSDRFNSGHLLELSILSRNFSLALHNAFVHFHTRKMAALDPMTSIFNRRFGMIRFNEELARALRTESPLGVIMVDIDHFKKVNDTFGHLAGDKVIVNLVKTIKNILREGDIICRYGGEEFLIILPGADTKGAFEISERIRIIIEKQSSETEEWVTPVTISLGITSWPENSSASAEQLICSADKALYQSKNKGRNSSSILTI